MACPITGKVQHATREEAEAHQKKLVYKNYLAGQNERSIGLNVYPCPHAVCGAWHVGHSEGLKMPLVYHYTVGRYMDRITKTGELQPPTSARARARSAAINEPNPLLWFSWNPHWEHSVTKDPRPRGRRHSPPTGRAITEMWGKGLIRYGAPATVAKLRWNDYLKLNTTPFVQRELMAQCGNPVDWLATDQVVPLEKCRTFEIWYRGAWVLGESVADEDFDTYLAGRMDVYNAAWLRLIDKILGADDWEVMSELKPEDEAELILYEDYIVRYKQWEWTQQHKDEVRKFAATLKGRRR